MQSSDPITFFFDNLNLFGSKALAHLELSFVAIGVAIVLAVPLGVWLGHIHRGSFLAISVSNIGRALPSLAVISIGIGILGIGFLNTVVALVILAGPVILTNAYVAVNGVDPDAVQAARARVRLDEEDAVFIVPERDKVDGDAERQNRASCRSIDPR